LRARSTVAMHCMCVIRVVSSVLPHANDLRVLPASDSCRAQHVRRMRSTMMIAGVSVSSGLMVGTAPATRASTVQMASIGETCKTLQGPEILWGPDGPLQDPMMEESDVRGYDGFSKFAVACETAGVDLGGGEYTVFVPTDTTIDEYLANGGELSADVLKYHIVPGKLLKSEWPSADMKTLQGQTLTYRRMFRKDFIDDASPGVEPAGASKGNSFPADLACDNGLIHACNLVLQPNWEPVN